MKIQYGNFINCLQPLKRKYDGQNDKNYLKIPWGNAIQIFCKQYFKIMFW